MAAASSEVDVKSSKEEEQKRVAFDFLRSCSKARIASYMRQMLDHKDLPKLNSGFLSAQELKDLRKTPPVFPVDKPVLTPLSGGSLRDRPVLKVKEYKHKILCAHVSLFYRLHFFDYSKEDLSDKPPSFWAKTYPVGAEVSHLFDGIRPDINPLNFTVEQGDINKSRSYCRLAFEKAMAEGADEQEARAEAKTCCERLHKPRCKLVWGPVGTAINDVLQARRQRYLASLENKKNQKEEAKAKARAEKAAAKERKKRKREARKEKHQARKQLNKQRGLTPPVTRDFSLQHTASASKDEEDDEDEDNDQDEDVVEPEAEAPKRKKLKATAAAGSVAPTVKAKSKSK